MRPWRTETFVDEVGQRLLLGLLLSRPRRFGELRIGEDHFDGTPRRIFAIIARHVRDHGAFDLDAVSPELYRARVLTTAHACAEEWQRAPLSLRLLERDLQLCLHRRRLNCIGEALLEVARDPTFQLADLITCVRDLTRMLQGLLVDAP